MDMLLSMFLIFGWPMIMMLLWADRLVWDARQRGEQTISVWKFIPLLLIAFPLVGPIVALVFIFIDSYWFERRVCKAGIWKKLEFRVKLNKEQDNE